MDRPIRPFPYFSKSQRIKNNTPRSDESWQRIVDESIEYDKKIELYQGNARAELQIKPEIRPLEAINIPVLISSIVLEFERLNERKFEGEGIGYLTALILYCFESRALGFDYSIFEKSEMLTKNIFGTELTPSKSKGLFIVGGFGVGKTKMIEAINSFIFNAQYNLVTDVTGYSRPLRDYCINGKSEYRGFALLTASAIKESKDTPFYSIIQDKSNLLIDDLFSEDKHFGTEVLSTLIEERYSRKLKTHIICNYQGETLEETLAAYGQRYGSRVLDRAFEMFNFIEIKGNSKRR